MKILLYTISDFKDGATDCINMLLSSITLDVPIDFAIITNVNVTTNLNITHYQTIVDKNTESQYIGSLKYSPKIPQNYDYYIYLDSDILYFNKISSFIDTTKLFTIVRENYKINDDPWHYFQYMPDSDKIHINNAEALNAGSFAFSSSQYLTIQEMYKLYMKYQNNDIHHDVRLEQAIYNYIIHKATQFNLSNCHDMTATTELFASNKSKIPNKTLYHFCGFDNTMISKQRNMRIFYDRYFQ